MGTDFIQGLFVWNTPSWAGYVSIGAAAVPSAFNLLVSYLLPP
jgi:hypothetical protein